jgi:hypothetical protein
MKKSAKISDNISFISGGGEMGALIRSADWGSAALGAPASWPQPLRLTLSMMLSSKFPMFLFWGDELTCFYNDPFRPSLGDPGKHPAIGKPGREVWAEIWDFIGPLIDQVRTTGVPVWYEDQLVPFFRNGKLEEIYWTFSYSAIHSDTGDIDGVLVICTETTDTVRNNIALTDSQERFKAIADNIPNLCWMAAPDGSIFWYNKQWYDYTDAGMGLAVSTRPGPPAGGHGTVAGLHSQRRAF